ncbi:diguanylate cyclase domain-containing protein [Vreelandella aquamarina]
MHTLRKRTLLMRLPPLEETYLLVGFLLIGMFAVVTQAKASETSSDQQTVVAYKMDHRDRMLPGGAPEGLSKHRLAETINFNFGMVSHPLWILLSIDIDQPKVLHVNNPLIHNVTLYRYDEDVARWSDALPRMPVKPIFSNAPANWRALFDVASSGDYLLRLESSQALRFDLNLSSKEAMHSAWRGYLLGQGMYFGLVLGLMVYNAFLLIFLRDFSYFWYIGFISSSAGYFFLQKGLLFELLPNAPATTNDALLFTTISTGLFSALSFCQLFLSVDNRDPRLTPWFNGFLTLSVVVLALAWLYPGQLTLMIYSVLGLGTLLLFTVASCRALQRGFHPAQWLIIGWAALLVGCATFIFSIYGILPHTFWTYYGFQMGSALEVMLFSLALADRIKILHSERETLVKDKLRFVNLSFTDGLTGLCNRRYLNQHLAKCTDRIQHFHPLTLIMIDLDHFKDFNDRWGHVLGDRALVHMAEIMKGVVRDKDPICRYGGEEFTIVLQQQPMDKAFDIAERIRRELEQTPLKTDGGKDLYMTCTMGIAEYQHGESTDAFINRADEALYRGKSQGRNCVLPYRAIPSV